MGGKNEIKYFIPYQSEFSHGFASWARNHMGWAKMKKLNRRLAKRRLNECKRKEADSEQTTL